MAENTFDVLIRFITEMVGKDAAQDTLKSMAGLEKQIDESNKLLEKQNKTLQEWKSKLRELKAELEGVRKGGAAYKQIKSEIAELNEYIRNGTDTVRENREAHKELVKQLEKENAAQQAIIRSLNQQEAILNKRGALASRAASRLQSFGTTAVVAGTAIGGGIIAEATRYAAKVGDATKGTAAFNAELKKLESARGRIDQVLVAQVLPILEVASKVASKVAGIIESNPQLVSIALKGAALLVSIGTLAKIAAGGIRMYADATFAAAQALGLKAAEMQLLASNNQLLAAGKGAGGVAVAAGGLTAGNVGIAAVAFTALNLGMVKLINLSEDAAEKLTKSSAAAKVFGGFLTAIIGTLPAFAQVGPLRSVFQALEDFGNTGKGQEIKNGIKGWWEEITKGTEKATEAAQKFGENTDQLVQAFSQMQSDLLAEDRKFADSKLKINKDADQKILEANKSLASSIASINAQAQSNRSKIISDFTSNAKKDQQQYERNRAQIVRDGGLEIVRIEQERLEKLRELEMDHNDRVDELAANRDALGLVLEQRRFDREKSKIDEDTNKEIAQRRQDLAIRLQDLAANFAVERAQKQAQFQQDLKDNEARRQEQIKEERARNAEQLRKIREDRIIKLQELAIQHRDEILKIRESFLKRRQELGIFLTGEEKMLKDSHARMLAELSAFLAAEGRLRTGGTTTAGSRATGGYVNNELIQTHGIEFVTSASTTRALERMIGGRLNQQNLVSAVAAGSNVQWNDQRRFSGEYTKSMRREVQRDTIDIMKKVLVRK